MRIVTLLLISLLVAVPTIARSAPAPHAEITPCGVITDGTGPVVTQLLQTNANDALVVADESELLPYLNEPRAVHASLEHMLDAVHRVLACSAYIQHHEARYDDRSITSIASQIFAEADVYQRDSADRHLVAIRDLARNFSDAVAFSAQHPL